MGFPNWLAIFPYRGNTDIHANVPRQVLLFPIVKLFCHTSCLWWEHHLSKETIHRVSTPAGIAGKAVE